LEHNSHAIKCIQLKLIVEWIFLNVYRSMWPPSHRVLPLKKYHFKLFSYLINWSFIKGFQIQY
jgi:hypothetical protein